LRPDAARKQARRFQKLFVSLRKRDSMPEDQRIDEAREIEKREGATISKEMMKLES
jgi:hypothetical protein